VLNYLLDTRKIEYIHDHGRGVFSRSSSKALKKKMLPEKPDPDQPSARVKAWYI